MFSYMSVCHRFLNMAPMTVDHWVKYFKFLSLRFLAVYKTGFQSSQIQLGFFSSFFLNYYFYSINFINIVRLLKTGTNPQSTKYEPSQRNTYNLADKMGFVFSFLEVISNDFRKFNLRFYFISRMCNFSTVLLWIRIVKLCAKLCATFSDKPSCGVSLRLLVFCCVVCWSALLC